ncbi:hypothetical protein M9Y10_002236 [Tritrichomonas musculus]|uniref:Thioredoxin domain-containing protein n=1 Tax=Tritrichomonas musculus TaxID=1915356 RepID=A0ABR2LA61_9EUKA
MIINIFSIFISLNFYISPISAESFHLNQEVFTKIINIKDRAPIFIEIWDPHCHNCKAFKSDWEKLTSLEYFHKKIIFADLNCISENKICQKISPGKEFPRFVWFDADKLVPRAYTGSYLLQDLALWLKSQLQNPIEVINDSVEFEKHKQLALKMSLFRFTINEQDEKSFQILNSAIDIVKHLNIKMILSYTNQQTNPQIEHFTPDNRVITMKDPFSSKSIVRFIKVHSIRFFIPFNDFIGVLSSAEKIPIMVFVFPHNNSRIRKVAINAAKIIDESSMIPISQLSCSYNPHFCRYYGIKNDDEKILVVIINKFRSFFWKFEYNDSIQSLQNWTTEVLKYRIRPSGPGAVIPFLKPVFEMFYEFRAQGGWKYYLFFAPVVAFVMLMITLAMYISTINLEKNCQNCNSKDKKD